MPAGQTPGGMNTIIPLFDVSGQLKIEFSRNPKSYPLNRYTAQINSSIPRGAYAYFNPNEHVRQRQTSKWAYGQPMPTGYDNLLRFEQKNFVCERYAFPATLDMEATNWSSFDVRAMHAKKLAQQAMINRTAVVLGTITTTSNYPSANVVTATVAGGGFLSGGTTADPRILNALTYASNLIMSATGGRAGLAGARFGVLMNHNTAVALSRTREIREYVMQQANSPGMITGASELMDATAYMLPPRLYKFDVVVEDTFRNTGNPDSALDLNLPVFPDNTLIVYVVDGGFEKSYGDQSFSTFTQFVYEDMTTESAEDAWNRLIHLKVVDNFDFKITSPVTGVVITNIFS